MHLRVPFKSLGFQAFEGLKGFNALWLTCRMRTSPMEDGDVESRRRSLMRRGPPN